MSGSGGGDFARFMAMMMEQQLGPDVLGDDDADFLRTISCSDIQSIRMQLESRTVNDPITAKRMTPLYHAWLLRLETTENEVCKFGKT